MSCKRYIWTFAAWFIGLNVLVAILKTVYPNLNSIGVLTVLPFFSAILTGQMFVKKEGRAPDEDEKSMLTNRSFMVNIFFNLVIFAFIFLGLSGSTLSDSFPALSIRLIISTAIAASLIFGMQYIMVKWAYSGLLEKHAPKILAKQNSSKH